MIPKMRTIIVIGSLSLILSAGTAVAQPSQQSKKSNSSMTAQMPRTPSDTTKADQTLSIQERIAQYMTQCLTDWDAATHMTKAEWARVCRRVIDNRVKFRLETGLRLPDPR
jgi:hypothetical protein